MVEFRIALLSGEVETYPVSLKVRPWEAGSGLLCYPGKLKRHPGLQRGHDQPGSGLLCYPGKLKLQQIGADAAGTQQFRIALLSGEVETRRVCRLECRQAVPDGFAIRGS